MAENTRHSPKQQDYAFDLERVFASVVAVKTTIPEDAFTARVLGTERQGNGVVIREDGLVLTIGYLVTEAEQVWLLDNFGRIFPGHVLAYDQETGFGIVQALGAFDLPALPLGDSAAVREGDRVILAGHGGRRGSVAAEVTAVREFAGYWEYLLESAIFTAPAHPNWGGAGLISAEGALVGIGSLMVQQTGQGEEPVDGNMVVPIDLLKPILQELVTTGRVDRPARPWLGLFGTEIQDHVVVAAVTEGSPAEKADLQAGDVVIAVDQARVRTLADFFRKVWALGPAGVEVPLTLARDGEIVRATLRSVAREKMLKSPAMH